MWMLAPAAMWLPLVPRRSQRPRMLQQAERRQRVWLSNVSKQTPCRYVRKLSASVLPICTTGSELCRLTTRANHHGGSPAVCVCGNCLR